MTIIKITAEELKDKIEHGLNVTVVNVVSEDLYKDCHIKGSINSPLEQLKNIASDWDKSREIIVYCTSNECNTSTKAYEILLALGFKRLYLYEGGTKEWKEKGFNYVGPCLKLK